MADLDDARIPLCVDLDGTLLRTDMLHEALLLLAKNSPRAIASVPVWISKGKAKLKHLVAELVEIDSNGLPYRTEVLDLIAAARAEGRPVVLTTAAPARIASAIASHLGLFDDVISSSEDVNLSRDRKADALTRRFGRRGFDYIGNSWDDLPVLASARRGFLVSSSKRMRGAASRIDPNTTFMDDAPRGVRTWMRALRVHQWMKNGLIFVPLLVGQEGGNPHLLAMAALAFVSFSLFASSVYLLNDMLDLEADRLHRTKKRRAFASGDLPVAYGVFAVPLLVVASLLIAFMLPGRFLLVLLLYGIATTAYSFWLKRQVVVDVLLLAALYTVRVLAGAAATGIQPSFWLLAFSVFIFLSLAMVKRYSELRLALDEGKPLAGRGYFPTDLPVILNIGSGSGLVAVLILALYIQSEIVPQHYRAPEWLWLVPPGILYWVVRLWMKAGRGEIDDDPVIFAARDWQSLIVLATTASIFGLAIAGWKPW